MQAGAMRRMDDEILLGQVRAIQETFEPRAHRALIQWGAWSRTNASVTTGGDRPQVKSSSIYQDVLYERLPLEPLTAYVMDTALGTKKCNDPSVVADPDEETDVGTDLRLGEQIDLLVHVAAFSEEWRRILRAIYVDRLPHWQWAKDAKVKSHRFIGEFSAALQHLSQRLP